MSIQPTEYVTALPHYVPGKAKGAEYVKLSSNENPLGPPPLALQYVRDMLDSTHRYPDDSAIVLRTELAQHLNSTPNSILLGTGSDEVLALAIHAYLGSGDYLVTSLCTFPMYRIFAMSVGAAIIEVPLKHDFHIDILALADQAPPGSVVAIANPNNPTGCYLDGTLVRTVMETRRDVLWIYDGAYAEYQQVGHGFTHEWLDQNPHVVVSRTFSKAYGLAGFRLGYLWGAEATIEKIRRLRPPFNCSSVALAAGLGALRDVTHLDATIDLNNTVLATMCGALAEKEIVFLPTQANFLLMEIPKSSRHSGGQSLAAALEAEKILVRALPNQGIERWIRVSTGTLEESRLFLIALEKVL